MKRRRVAVSLTPQAFEALQVLLWQGLHGPTMAEVAERLLCEGIQQAIQRGLLKGSDLQETTTHG